MRKEHIQVRNKLKSISTYKTFYQILDEVILTDEERKFTEMFYLEGKSLDEIADELGISKATASRKHSKILNKLIKVI